MKTASIIALSLGLLLALILILVVVVKNVNSKSTDESSSGNSEDPARNVPPPPPKYVITSAGNVFAYYRQNSRLHTVSIPTGVYSNEQQLADAMTQALSAEEPGWSVTWNAPRQVFVFTNTTFRWDRCDNPASIYSLVKLKFGAERCGAAWKNEETGDPIL
jgi:hypothetical protein